jgi:hypothetical protein
MELELDLSIDLSDEKPDISSGGYETYETNLLEDWIDQTLDEDTVGEDHTSETQSYSSVHETELIQLYTEGSTYE